MKGIKLVITHGSEEIHYVWHYSCNESFCGECVERFNCFTSVEPLTIIIDKDVSLLGGADVENFLRGFKDPKKHNIRPYPAKQMVTYLGIDNY